MGSGLSVKTSVTLRDDTTTFTEPSSGSDGADLKASRDGAYLKDRSIVMLRKGATAGGGDITITGPVYLDLYIRDNWYKAGELNSGEDIVLGDTGFVQLVDDVGAATRAAVHAGANPADNVTVEIAFIDDDDE